MKMLPVYRLAATCAHVIQWRTELGSKPNPPAVNADSLALWKARKAWLERELLPSGSGFDAGTTLDETKSNGDKLVFNTSFHHMNAAGMYTEWTEHTVTVTPSLMFGRRIAVSGKDKNGIKAYIENTFGEALDRETDWPIYM